MPDTGAETRPHEPVSGGCLCKAVRYSVAFPEGSWPPTRKDVCHCTQCRKATGSLMTHILTVEPNRVTWITEGRSFREFSSSPGVLRGFCQNCGSTLTWRNVNTPAEIDLYTGTLDECVLLGADEGAGRAILAPERQLWCVNRVEGVSDGVKSKVMYQTDVHGEVIES